MGKIFPEFFAQKSFKACVYKKAPQAENDLKKKAVWLSFVSDVQTAINSGNNDFLREVFIGELQDNVNDRIVHRAFMGGIGVSWVDAEWQGKQLLLDGENSADIVRFHGEFSRGESEKLKKFSDVWHLVEDPMGMHVVKIDQNSSLF